MADVTVNPDILDYYRSRTSARYVAETIASTQAPDILGQGSTALSQSHTDEGQDRLLAVSRYRSRAPASRKGMPFCDPA